MSLALLAWLTVAGWPEAGWPATGSYRAISPTLQRSVIYDDQEIGREAERIRASARPGEATMALYQLLPLFARPERLLTDQAWEWLDMWRACRTTGAPLARSLDEAPAHAVLAFEVLDRETRSAGNWRAANQKDKA